MNLALARVIDEVALRIRPSPDDEAHLQQAVDDLLWRARSVAREARDEGAPSFDPMVVGSTAKGTWLPGHVDIDLFLMYDPSVDRATLEEEGLKAGKKILPRWNLRYAEHPYVHGPFEGYDADVVPAYAVDDAAQIQSAVDRTPFHNAYVLAALEVAPERREDIRLMKAWLKGIGVYGAETAHGGFSGYLTEVLTLHHAGFLRALEAYRDYHEGMRIDPTGGSNAQFPPSAFVVVDPVDPGRNAASAVRLEKLERLRQAAAAFLDTPSERFFEPVPLPPLTPDLADQVVGDGGAAVVTFPVPDMRDDARVPHLMRAADSLGKLLHKQGFSIRMTDGGLSDDGSRAYLYVRTGQSELPPTREHMGPPVDSGHRAADFRRKYDDHPDVIEPVHERDDHGRTRLAVVLRQHERALGERIEQVLRSKVSLGKHASKALAAGHEVMDVAEAVSAPDLERVVAELLSPVPPWARTGDAANDYGVA